jgi:hypothetical protein
MHRGFLPHAFSLNERILALREYRQRGVRTRATIAPLLPIGDVEGFDRELDAAEDCVIVDHCMLGDRSPGSLRTKRTAFPGMLAAAGLQANGGIERVLREAGIDYQWLVELRNPLKRDPSMAVLKAQLAAADDKWPVHRGLSLLAAIVRDETNRSCLLCACVEYRMCHRLVIAEALAERHFVRQLTIIDIQPSRRVEQ